MVTMWSPWIAIAQALVLVVSVSCAAFLPILDFHGRLGASLGGLVVAALDHRAVLSSWTVIAAKAELHRGPRGSPCGCHSSDKFSGSKTRTLRKSPSKIQVLWGVPEAVAGGAHRRVGFDNVELEILALNGIS